MPRTLQLSRHARDRSTARNIPPLVAELIVSFGSCQNAGDGAITHFLTKESMRFVKKECGKGIADALGSYRNRNAYVVTAQGRVVTMAFGYKKRAA